MWDNFQFRSLWEIFDLRDHFQDLHISKITTKDLLTYWFSLLRSHLDEANTLILTTKNFIFILSTCVPVFSLAFVTIFTTSLHVSNLILRTVQISILLILIRLYWFWQFEHFQSWKSFITFKQQMRVSSWHSRNNWTLSHSAQSDIKHFTLGSRSRPRFQNFQHRLKYKMSLPFVVGLRVVIIGLLVVRLVVVLLVVMIGLRVVVLLVVRLVVVVGFGVVVVVVVVDVVVVLVVVVVGGSVVVGFLFLFFFAACFFSRSFLFLSLSAAAAAFSALFRFTEPFDTLNIGCDP